MRKLVKGLHRFHSGVFDSKRKLFDRLARRQTPECLFIACSDSRINPNLFTQTEPGDLFILRNAGNIVPTFGVNNGGEAATIEFAVAGLGVKDIIVCGHSHCGAMYGLLDPAKFANMPVVAQFMVHAESTRRIMKENYPALKGDALFDATIQENVLIQLEHLETHPAVAVRLARGDLKLHGWVYQIETGGVFAFDPGQAQFVSLLETPVTKPLPKARLAKLVSI
jgi:carbonic anhydrase